jgi:type II secretory pathway component PulF
MGETLGPFNLILLALPGIALKLAVRIMYGRRAYAAADPLKILLSVAGTLMIVLAVLGAIIGLVGVWWMLIPVLVVFGVVMLMAYDRFRRGEHRALVWTLATAAQRGVPLPEAARAYADESQDDSGARALALAQSLERGQPLSQAVRDARLRLGTPIRVAVRLGESLGMLGQAMRQQLEDALDTDSMVRSVTARFFWLYTTIVVLSGVMTFVMLRIVPVFQKMFEEFGLKLPEMTMLLINFSNWFVQRGWFLSFPLMILLTICAWTVPIAAICYMVGWFPRDLPVLWRLFRRYDGAIVMRGLALAVRRGVPLVDALGLLAATYPITRIGQQLHWATVRVAQGIDWRRSLLQAGLITSADAAVLAAAERVGNLPWALEEMADSALRRQMYWLQLGMQLLYPVLILLVGGLVGFFVIGLFLPLLSLIQGLS